MGPTVLTESAEFRCGKLHPMSGAPCGHSYGLFWIWEGKRVQAPHGFGRVSKFATMGDWIAAMEAGHDPTPWQTEDLFIFPKCRHCGRPQVEIKHSTMLDLIRAATSRGEPVPV